MKQTLLNNLKSVQASLANGIATRWTLDYHCKHDLTQISHLLTDTLGEIENEESAQPSEAIEALEKLKQSFVQWSEFGLQYFDIIENTILRAESEHAELEALKAPTIVHVDENRGIFICDNCLKNGETDSEWLFEEKGEYTYCPRCGKKLNWEVSK